MVISFLGWVARRRVAVLSMALLTAVALGVLLEAIESRDDMWLSIAVRLTLPFAVFLCSAYSARVSHPAKLVARPEISAFDVPLMPGAVLDAAGLTLYVVPFLIGLAIDIADDEEIGWLPVCFMVFTSGVLAAGWKAALGRSGVRLTSDGVEDRDAFGSLFVPWDALAVPRATCARGIHQVSSYLARPELVRRRGFRRGGLRLLSAKGINAEYLARAIHEYANHADLRPTIGSEAARTRFQAIPEVIDIMKRA